jgi:hypothetical protein
LTAVVRILSIACLALLTVEASVAEAQEASGDKAVAEQLFQDGRQLMKSGQVAAACPKFAESYRLAQKLGTLLNLATCHEEQGRTASAWAEFREAASQAKKVHEDERETYALEHLRDLEGRLSRLVIDAPDGGPDLVLKLVVKLDGQALGPAALGASVPVDPGDHVVEAFLPGRQPWRSSVHAPEGPATTRVRVPLLDSNETPTPAPLRAPPEEGSSDRSGRRAVGFAIGGLGVVGVVVGSVFGAKTFSLKSERDQHCQHAECDPRGLELHDEAKRAALISTVSFAAGGVALLAGGVLAFTDLGRTKSTRTAVQWSPAIGSGGAQMVLRSTW